MSDISYLKNASTPVVADACRQYGAIAFMGNGLTELQKLEILSAAVQDLNNKLCNSEMFFTTSVKSDDLYESVTYSVDDFNSNLALVRLKKTIVFKVIHPIIPTWREARVEYGPFVPREKAQAIADAMNA
jgi:hypothetical protein